MGKSPSFAIVEGSPVNYQCVLCDFFCEELHKMFGHQASEHIKTRPKRSPRKCQSCGLPLGQCSENGNCPKGNPQEPTRSQIRKGLKAIRSL